MAQHHLQVADRDSQDRQLDGNQRKTTTFELDLLQHVMFPRFFNYFGQFMSSLKGFAVLEYGRLFQKRPVLSWSDLDRIVHFFQTEDGLFQADYTHETGMKGSKMHA